MKVQVLIKIEISNINIEGFKFNYYKICDL